MAYTFGDTELASQRLRHLAEVYEPESRALLQSAMAMHRGGAVDLALDLGCGPGWSTQLVHAIVAPRRMIGLEFSERYLAEARSHHPHLEFLRHDVLQTPFPVASADLLFCRFLLTHLPSPAAALNAWAQAAAPGALLVIHETESLQADDPALSRYYQMVADMQRHHGQELNAGAVLNASLAETPWRVRHSAAVVLEKSARDMAQLHLPNLRTWGGNGYAQRAFDRAEIATLDRALERVASGAVDAGTVRNAVRQIVAERGG